MARLIAVAENIDASATAAAETGVLTNVSPFFIGRKVKCAIRKNGVTGTPTTLVQTSPDNSTWTTQITDTTLIDKEVELTLDKYVRLNRSVAGSAGRISVYLDGSV